jgi:hypothetical protein
LIWDFLVEAPVRGPGMLSRGVVFLAILTLPLR